MSFWLPGKVCSAIRMGIIHDILCQASRSNESESFQLWLHAKLAALWPQMYFLCVTYTGKETV